jgi:hypothetical protein
LISTALLLDSGVRGSVCTPAGLPCRRVVEGSEKNLYHSDVKIYVLKRCNFDLVYFKY